MSEKPDSQVSYDAAFVQLLSSEQLKLLRYIAVLLGDSEEAHNVLQETNMVMCRKSKDYEPGTNFSAWAHKIAYWQVLAFVRDRQRDRHVFCEEVIEQLASTEVREQDDVEARIALRHCLKGLDSHARDLLRRRYEENLSVTELSQWLGKSYSATRKELWRLRRNLFRCIQTRLATQK
ncbi:sigma-70 family RNA polymerase sigma factor [Aeoliella sp.]|uniref:sigma-70 family RNA polymerase sigma factor n=1 Tax=Aeoliella sp. TaxID=2795800 RepID=UPI003CCBC136